MAAKSAHDHQHEELSCLVIKAQNGDKLIREQLIKEYRPFYLRAASQVAKKYLVLGRDDEASIAMSAFDEAINAYNPKAGASFLSFAEIVIKRRMVDFFRRKARSREEIPLSALETEDTDDNIIRKIELKEAYGVIQVQQETEERREEIFRLNQLLSEYGVRFSELVKISPKHQDARDRALEVARILANDPELLKFLTQRKALPLKELEKVVKVSRKTLERQRKYIITLTLILVGEFHYLQEYLKRSV
ncbi:MAG: RNA polymerase sigma-I factor [Candidatus Wallacebacter cryptica]|jgi:RNA polymerase sigma factor|nr:RNA polymerase sigma-I factor [Bacillota bacterium]